MKILYLGDMESPHCYKLAEYFVKKGYEIITLSEFEPTLKIPNVQYYSLIQRNRKFLLFFTIQYYRILRRLPSPLKLYFRLFFICLMGFNKIIHKIKPDLIHAHYTTDYGIFAKHSKFRPFIISCWGSDIMIIPKNSKYYKYEVNKVLNNAEFIHTSASHLTKEIINNYGIKKDKIVQCQYGLNKSVIDFLSKKRNEFANRTIQIISTRAAKVVYNNETLILAAKILQDLKINIHIKMFSGGRLFNRYKNMLKMLKVTNLELLHFIPSNELYNYYLKSDIYVSCSLSDGLSIALLEAFAAKSFPIVTDIEANRNVIRHKKNGRLFDTSNPSALANEIVDVINNNKEIENAIAYNTKWVIENQTLEKNLIKIQDLYALFQGKK